MWEHLWDITRITQALSSKEERREMKTTYANRVGSIMYGMVCSRSNLTHVVSVISKFMSNRRHAYWETLKWILIYLDGTISSSLVYRRLTHNRVVIEGFVDVEYAGNVDTRESLFGYVFTLFGTIVF